MSGTIRMVIGPTRTRLHLLLQTWKNFQPPNFSLPQSEQLNNIQQKLYDLTELRLRIFNASNLLDTQKEQWAHYMSTLSGPDLDAEEQRLSEFNQPTPEGVPGFIDLMLEAKDQLSRIDVRLEEWRHTLASLERALSSPRTMSTPPLPESSHFPLMTGIPTETTDGLTSTLSSVTTVPITTVAVPVATGQGPMEQFGGSFAPLPLQSIAQWNPPIFTTRVDTQAPITGAPMLTNMFGGQQQQSLTMTPIVKLPKLDLPTFFGEETKFFAFWESFESQIHRRSDLSSVDKFRFLKRALKGPASDVIAGIEETNNNYNVAVTQLRERYGDPGSIIQLLYSQLEKIPKSSSKIAELQHTLDNTEKTLRQLENLKQDINNPVLVNIVKNKFPNIMLDLERVKRNSQMWNMSELRSALKEVIGMRKRAFPEGTGASSNSSKPNQSYNKGNPRTPAFQNAGIKPESTNAPCVFCKGHHSLTLCRTYKSADERYSRLCELRLCTFCLKPGHVAKLCSQRGTVSMCCQNCQSTYHRTFLCPKGSTQPFPSQPPKQFNYNPNQTHYNTFKHQNNNNKPNFNKPQPRQVGNKMFQGGSRQRQGTGRPPAPAQLAMSSISETDEPHVEQLQDMERAASPGHLAITNSEQNQHNSELQLLTQQASQPMDMLMTATAMIGNPTDQMKNCKVKLILDSGSTKSYVLNEIKEHLDLPVEYTDTLNILSFNSSTPKRVPTNVVVFRLFLQDGNFLDVDAHTVGTISGTLIRPQLSKEDLKILKSQEPTLADTLPEKNEKYIPEVLLGSNCFCSLFPWEKRLLPSGLNLISSHLGDIITGSGLDTRMDHNSKPSFLTLSKSEKTPAIVVYNETPPELPDLMKMWSLEDIGIRDDPSVTSDDEALLHFQNSLQFKEGKYFMNWLWKTPIPELPTNRDGAYKRFVTLMKKLEHDRTLLKSCNDIITMQLTEGILEPVTDESKTEGLTHYLPHRPVITPSKTTTKTRIVMDASAKATSDSPSLNDCLLRGPIILPEIPGIFMRFRLGKYGACADVAKAFLQLHLHKDQRDATRIFWIKSMDVKPLWQESNLIILRHTRVLFGAKCSPSMLNLTIDHHLSLKNSKIAEMIRKNTYVDNLIVATSDLKQLLELYSLGTSYFSEMNMHLREWGSNCTTLMDSLQEKDKTKDVGNITILGFKWDLDTDELTFPYKEPECTKTITKRRVAEMVGAWYDLLGLLNPMIVAAKLFLQKLWQEKFPWDQELPPPLVDEFKKILAEMRTCQQYKILRHLNVSLLDADSEFGLIGFTDASQQAYCVNIYLAVFTPNKTVLTLLFSKVRLFPTKEISMPRKELIALFLGPRLLQYVKQQLCTLKISHEILFTDSRCVLYWINTRRKLPVFVENRICKLKNHKTISFQYIETSANPADYGTRPQTKESFDQCKDIWFNGPSFMKEPRMSWQQISPPDVTIDDLDAWELGQVEHPNFLTQTTQNNSTPILSPERFSTWKGLIMTTAMLFLLLSKWFISKFKESTWDKFSTFTKQLFNFDNTKGVSPQLITRAEYYWIHFFSTNQITRFSSCLENKEKEASLASTSVLQKHVFST